MNNITIRFDQKAEKALRRLPLKIQEKFAKQIILLTENAQHPSLNLKRMKSTNRWESRIDRRYRFTFIKIDDSIFITSLGMHDTGLGKK